MRNRFALDQDYILRLKSKVIAILDAHSNSDVATSQRFVEELDKIICANNPNILNVYGRMLELINRYRRRRFQPQGDIYILLEDLLVSELSSQEEANWEFIKEFCSNELEPVTFAVLRVINEAKEKNVEPVFTRAVVSETPDAILEEKPAVFSKFRPVLKTAAWVLGGSALLLCCVATAFATWPVAVPVIIMGMVCAGIVGGFLGLGAKQGVEHYTRPKCKEAASSIELSTSDIFKKFAFTSPPVGEVAAQQRVRGAFSGGEKHPSPAAYASTSPTRGEVKAYISQPPPRFPR